MPQNDGFSNLAKYVFDIAPNEPMTASDRAGLPTVGMTTTNGVNYLTMTYRQNPTMSGVTVQVQTSPDLQMWTPVTPDFTQMVGIDPSTGDPMMEVGVHANGATRLFINLQVTLP